MMASLINLAILLKYEMFLVKDISKTHMSITHRWIYFILSHILDYDLKFNTMLTHLPQWPECQGHEFKNLGFSWLKRKYVHQVLVNSLGGLSLPRKSVGWLTDRPDMTLDVYRGRKTTIQQQLG